ncbi:MAG: HDOD domain-containing protein [bacterium]
MQRVALPDLISRTNELAALPTSVVRILELLDDITVGADRVLTVIDKDPALTANLLKLCNSAYYAMPRKIGNTREALILLGNKTVLTLAFASSMGNIMRGPLLGYGLGREQLWQHALATALAASYLASETRIHELSDRAFTAGLLHDIGKLLLNDLLTEQVDQLPRSTQTLDDLGSDAGPRISAPVSAVNLRQAEHDILGFDHCQAGAALTEAWQFPDMLSLAIRHHHEPVDCGEDGILVRVVYAANQVAKGLGLGGFSPAPISTDDLRALTDLGIPHAAIVHLLDHLSEDVGNLLNTVVRTR